MDRKHLLNRKWLADASRRLRAAKPGPRWRNVLFALLLAFVMGNAGRPPLAQADGEKIGYVVFATTDRPGPICLGRYANILALVKADIFRKGETPGTTSSPGYWSFQWVNGTVQDPDIGTLVPERSRASLLGDNPTMAHFYFTARKVGTTTLSFKADIPASSTSVEFTNTASQPMRVTVIPCKFMVSSITTFPGNDNPGAYQQSDPAIVVRMDQAEVTADANGQFTGSATLHWIGTTSTTVEPGGSCTIAEKFAVTTQASISGDILAGQLTLDVTYKEPGVASHNESCGGASLPMVEKPYRLSQVRISLPASGGVTPLTQTQDQDSRLSTGVFVVIPVNGK
jgi:hypothetical protein